jgi:REP element-mobilizing transposase RayT
MLLYSYDPHTLEFAYCYRLYLSWTTYRQTPYPQVSLLNSELLANITTPLNIKVLESTATPSRIAAMLSLLPTESISSCVSKVKGGVSKWLRTSIQLEKPSYLLSKGYFAKTIGKSNEAAVKQYLQDQPVHHSYSKRVLPPVFVENYRLDTEDIERLNPAHALVVARFHIVLATSYRTGIFGAKSGELLANTWRQHQSEMRVALLKVSVVPDHVHLALQMHPGVSPAAAVAELMNIAQGAVQQELIGAGVDRLWQPSAYVGTFGDLTSNEVRKYINGLIA